MGSVFDKPSPWQRIKPAFSGFDGPLLAAMLLLGAAGLLTMYSAGFDAGTRFVDTAATCCWRCAWCSWWRRSRRKR